MSSAKVSSFELADLIACVEREVEMRRKVYDGLVRNNKMTREGADLEINMMVAAAEQLRKLAAAGPLFREAWARMAQLPADVVPLLEQGPKPREVFCAEPAKCRDLATTQAAAWLRLAVRLPAPPPAAPAVPIPAPAAAAPVGPATPGAHATAAQKEELIRCMNHPAIKRREKTQILISINRMTPEAAAKKIADLKKKADEYDGPGEVEGLVKELRHFVEQHGAALAMPECERLLTLCETEGVTASELRDNLATARREVELHVAA